MRSYLGYDWLVFGAPSLALYATVDDGGENDGAASGGASGTGATSPAPPAATGATGTGGAAGTGTGTGSDPAEIPSWAKDRINAVTAQKNDWQRRAEAAEAEIAVARAGTPPVTMTPPTPAPAPAPTTTERNPATGKLFTEKEVLEEASRIADVNTFNATCNDIHAKGVKAFEDFPTAIARFQQLGGLSRPLVEAAAETGEPERVLYELSKNMNEAGRILGIQNPVRQAAAVVKFAAGLEKPGGEGEKTPKAPASGGTKAPDPIPVRAGNRGGATAADLSDPNISQEAWFAARQAQLASRNEERRNARRGR